MNNNKSKTIGIIGVGFVGEHLMNAFSRVHNYNIISFDISENRISYLKNIYSTKNNVRFTTNQYDLTNVDCYLVCVPTNVVNEQPDLTNLIQARNLLRLVAKQGSTIVIESSVYVGATRELFSEFSGCGIYVGFSPERVDPGRIEPPTHEIPKIISGLNMVSLVSIREYYSPVFSRLVEVSSTETAEMCKLYENCFRLVNIAYVNEIADACNRIGINPQEMISASATKPFGFMPFYPGLGVGGHCIPNNPYYLMQNNRDILPIVDQSIKLMETRPISKAKQIVDQYFFNNVLIIGVGFKPGESLTVNSPGMALAKELEALGKDVYCLDPLVSKSEMISKRKSGLKFIPNNINSKYLQNNFDLIVVANKQHGIDFNLVNEYQQNGNIVITF